nr:putative mediator of RNA polymerase II transcription subunit 37c [Tanacetum cinerariifolium]
MVEHASSSSKSNPKGNCKCKGKNDKKSKGKAEYLASKATLRQINMVNVNVDMIAMVSDVIAMISKVNIEAANNGEKLYMGNTATTNINGEGDSILKMTSEKEIKLTNVLYVFKIHKNLMSDWLLNKFGFCLVFESDKFVLSKNQMYIGKGYALNGYKWIFKKKMKVDGTIDKYKARLLIKGFRQREGLYYFDMYSLFTRITLIRMILAIAALRNLEVHKIEVKMAFLNGDPEEEIYMSQPEGFIATG